MTDFRKADISKQESYDLLRDWIKLVARHTNPDQDISELLGWLWKLKPATPDPDTGMMPCGCGRAMRGVCYPGNHGLADAYLVSCYDCNVGTLPMRSADKAQVAWNRAMGRASE